MTTTTSAGAPTVDGILSEIAGPPPTIRTMDGVYPPSVDSALLCRQTVAELRERPHPMSVLELCAGSGIASVYAARCGAEVTAVDDDPAAIDSIDLNARLNGVRVSTRRADIHSAVDLPCADLVVANPPYLPAPPDSPCSHVADAHAWDAGDDGRAVLDAIIARAPELVSAGGTLVLVHSDVAGVAATRDALVGVGFDARIRHVVPLEFGPVMRARATWLEEHGFIDQGRRTERLVVITARRRRVECAASS